MRRRFRAISFFALVSLAACGGDTDDESIDAVPNTYEIDEETGETSARHTDSMGVTTTMRSGENVPVVLPAGFEVFPGAKIVNNTRVEQADGLLVLLNFESEADPEELAAFYRKQAEAAGIDVAMSLQSGPTTMIGGEAGNGTSFSLTATRDGETTGAQLSIGQGLQ